MSYHEYIDQDVRLCILRSLSDQTDYTLSEVLLQKVCETFGHRRTRDYLRAQIRWLADVGAVEATETQGYLIARLRRLGKDHVEGRTAIDGVNRPSPGA